MAGLYLAPALIYGSSLGPFDVGASLSGLGHAGPVPVHNGWLGDQIEQFIPWIYFDRLRLHQGIFPLWNPYSGLGMPQFFNFQSSVLSLPQLVGYLVPPQDAMLTAVALKLALAGSGAYLFARSLGLRPWAAAFAATVFELSGAFVNETGWPLGDVMAWTGWIFALSLLAHRRWRPRRVVPLLAVCVAFAIYGGFPEATLLLCAGCGLFVVLLGRSRGWAPVLAGWGAGLCLAAPLWLPGLQLVALSERIGITHPALDPRTLAGLLVPTYYGSPLTGWFGPGGSYNETVLYVGIAGLVLAAVGLYAGRGRREVRALAVMAACLLVLGYAFGPAQWLARHIPSLGSIALGRVRILLDFALAIFAGFGFDALSRPEIRRTYVSAVAAAGVALAALLADTFLTSKLPAAEVLVRLAGFLPSLLMLYPLGWAARGRGRWLGAVLLASETLYLLVFGALLPTYGHAFLPETAAERQLAARAGSAVVALAEPGTSVTHYPDLGIIPDLNVAFGVHELAVYDPMLPRSYFTAWAGLTGTPPGSGGWFVPPVSSAATARVFGVGYVLAPGPPRVALAPGYATHLAGALGAAGLSPSADLPALTALLHRYVAQSGLRAAVPAGSPGFAADLVQRAQAASAAGADNAALARIARGLSRSPALAAVIASALTVPDWNGMRFVAPIGGESLWRVPGSARFSFAGTVDHVTAARAVGDATWALSLAAPHAGRLIVRLTAVPGWHARIDGRPARLRPYLGVMQSLSVPAGAHTVRLWYWPRRFTYGLLLAALATAGLGGWLLAGRRSRDRRRAKEGTVLARLARPIAFWQRRGH